jgi:hypothetical protein
VLRETHQSEKNNPTNHPELHPISGFESVTRLAETQHGMVFVSKGLHKAGAIEMLHGIERRQGTTQRSYPPIYKDIMAAFSEQSHEASVPGLAGIEPLCG